MASLPVSTSPPLACPQSARRQHLAPGRTIWYSARLAGDVGRSTARQQRSVQQRLLTAVSQSAAVRRQSRGAPPAGDHLSACADGVSLEALRLADRRLPSQRETRSVRGGRARSLVHARAPGDVPRGAVGDSSQQRLHHAHGRARRVRCVLDCRGQSHRAYLDNYVRGTAGMPWPELLALGRRSPGDTREPFNMAWLAMRVLWMGERGQPAARGGEPPTVRGAVPAVAATPGPGGPRHQRRPRAVVRDSP